MNGIDKLSNRIPLQGTINTRSLEGFESKDGRKIKAKRIYRTDNLSAITDADKLYIKNVMNVKKDIDLRGYDEIERLPDKQIDGVEFIHCPIQKNLSDKLVKYPHEDLHISDKEISGSVEYFYSLDPNGDITYAFEKIYRAFVSEEYAIEHYAMLMKILLENKEGACMFHCLDGKDRCGVGVALFLSILDIDKETIIKDYLKTNQYTNFKADARVKYLKEVDHVSNQYVLNSIKIAAGVRQNFIEAAFNEINISFGGIDNYIENQLKITPAMRKAMKDNYLE